MANAIKPTDRKRKFFGQISYDYEHNGDTSLTEVDFKQSVEKRIKALCSNQEDKFYIIFHDKDQKDDGTPKPLHAHFYIDFKNPRAYSAVFKALSISRQENLEAVRSSIKACRYLTHRNERNMAEHKFPYEVSEVIQSPNGNYIDDIMGEIKHHSKEKSDNGLEVDDYCLELSYLISSDGLLPQEAKKALYTETLLPIADRIKEMLNHFMADDLEPSELIDYDVERIEVLQEDRNEKIKIAKSAARFLKNNAVFFIDSGSTASYLATLLDSFHSITVVTTSMLVANIMQSQGTDNYLYLPSGFVNYQAMHIYGRSVERSLQDFRFTAAFFGSSGIRYHDGPTVLDPQEIAYKSIVANNSEKCVIMCDHSKFSIGGVAQYLSWNKVDYFITDSGVTPENLSTLGSHPQIIIENSFYTP